MDDRSAAEETAGRGYAGQPPDDGGLGADPLRPSERALYDTDDTDDAESISAEPSSPPGVVVGLLLLAIFIAILAWAVVVGLR